VHDAWVFQAVSFPQDCPPKPCTHLSSPQTCYMPHLSHSSRFDHQSSTGCGVQIIKLFIVYFSHFSLLPRPSQAQIFSTLYSQTPSANVPPSIWATKFHPHTKNRQNYSAVYLNIYIFGQQTGRQKTLHRMIASIPRLQSALNLLLNTILISLYIVTSSCILISRHDHVHSFISIYF
jgi:hypothetical protein